MSKRAAFFTLLGSVYDSLPDDAVSRYIESKATPKADAVTLQNVRRGTTAKLDILVSMVGVCLPEHQISDTVLSSL